MKPEDEARKEIDQLLQKAGWIIQDLKELNLGAGLGVAVREFRLTGGAADYALFTDRRLVGVVEAKPKGTPLSGIAEQSEGYLSSVPANVPYAISILSEPGLPQVVCEIR